MGKRRKASSRREVLVLFINKSRNSEQGNTVSCQQYFISPLITYNVKVAPFCE